MSVKRIWSAQAVLLMLWLSGCSGLGTKRGSDGSTLPPDGSSTGVTVTPATATIRAGANEAFAATVSGMASTTVTWSVNSIAGGNASVGTIDANGMYTAPATLPTPNTVTVTATSTDDATQKGSTSVTLQNPIPVLNSVSPTAIPAGSFSLTLTGSGFVPTSAVTFAGKTVVTTSVSPTQLQATGTCDDDTNRHGQYYGAESGSRCGGIFDVNGDGGIGGAADLANRRCEIARAIDVRADARAGEPRSAKRIRYFPGRTIHRSGFHVPDAIIERYRT